MKQRFDLAGRFDGIRRTPQGGIIATANLTRVGVFTYYNADGSQTKELRAPDDIFREDALATLKLAPLTIGHPGMVTPENYRDLSVGVVGADVQPADKFVRATVHVQDAEAVRRVELGQTDPKNPDALLELSCGYECDVEKADGEYDGETYDSKQTGHRYNHVALGPANWGRAGSEVRLTLDSAGNAIPESYAGGMSTAPAVKTDDNKDTTARIDALTGERDALKAKLDAATAEVEKLKADLVGANALTSKLIDPAHLDALVASRVALESSARRVLGTDAKLEGKSDRDVMCEVLAKTDAKFDPKDRSIDYVRARFDASTEIAVKADAAVADANKASAAPEGKGVGEAPKSKLDQAIEKAAEEARAASKAGPPAGAVTRKA